MKDFSSLGLSEQVLKALPGLGLITPTEIQAKAIPLLLEEPTDFIGLAQTGTGKTAAFGLPLLDYVDPAQRHTQALVLAPTRELCQQIATQLIAFSAHMPKIRAVAVYGGAAISGQILALKRPTHVVIATPGRLIDMIKRKVIKLDQISNLVLDEADEMLNMGFKDELDEILSYIKSEKSTWLFSATMAPDIKRIIRKYMAPDSPEIVINAGQIVNENIEHRYVRLRMSEKTEVIKKFLDADPSIRGIIFCRTKLGTQALAEELLKSNYQTDALHGDLSQPQRDRVMKRFKAHQLKLIVATDVAARGIDVNDLTHIIHHSLPDELGYYTHRSGRTARAGKNGISLVLASGRDIHKMRLLARMLKLNFKEVGVPTETTIQADRLRRWTKDISELEISDELDQDLLRHVLTNLEEFSKEDLIQKFLISALGLNAVKKIPKKQPRREATSRPTSARSVKRKESKGRLPSADGDMTRFYINVGRMDQISKPELIDFLAKELKASKGDFGEIDLHDNHSYFELSTLYSKRVTSAFNGFMVNNRKLRINRDSDGPPKTKPKSKHKIYSKRSARQRT
jgi:ATP-dependent RNA helicase DeaD